MSKSTEMVQATIGYGFGMFRESDAGIKHNAKYSHVIDSGIVIPEMFTETRLGITNGLIDWWQRRWH